MKRTILLLIPLLAACGGGEGEGGREEGARSDSRAAVQTADLTGLYEVRAPEEGKRAQMCMISSASGTASFGIVTRNAAGGSCGGAGQAAREGDVLRLTMAGDEECVIEARMAGTRVTLPAGLPQGCDYYCGPGATLAGASFEKTGGTAADAMRASDLAGDPLCG
jgi:hypothetical protein